MPVVAAFSFLLPHLGATQSANCHNKKKSKISGTIRFARQLGPGCVSKYLQDNATTATITIGLACSGHIKRRTQLQLQPQPEIQIQLQLEIQIEDSHFVNSQIAWQRLILLLSCLALFMGCTRRTSQSRPPSLLPSQLATRTVQREKNFFVESLPYRIPYRSSSLALRTTRTRT